MTEQLLIHLTPPPQERESKEPPLHLYGIFNAEKYKNLWVKLECEWKFKHASLFADEALKVSMNNVAPYLVHIPINHPRITTLLKHYGHGGTLFFWSEEGFVKVLERMISLFEIRSNEGDEGYLAFYRPEMWNTLVQSNSSIRYTFFKNSPVFFCEDEYDISKLYIYSFNETQIYKNLIHLKNKYE